jgi:hypothetical protein
MQAPTSTHPDGANYVHTNARLRWAQLPVLAGVLALMGLVGWTAAIIDGGRANAAVAEEKEQEISSAVPAGPKLPARPADVAGSAIDRRTAIAAKKAPATPTATVPEAAATKSSLDTENVKTPADQPTMDDASVTVAKPERHDRTDDASPPSNSSPLPGADVGAAQNARALTQRSWDEFFNRKDLTGWDCRDGYWRVADGAIVGTPRPGNNSDIFLCSQKTYRDFDLKFRVLLSEGSGMASVQFRSRLTDPTKFTVIGPRCVICGKDSEPDYPAGSLLSELPGKPSVRPKPALAKKFIKPGENHFHIRCEGKVVVIKINGAPFVRSKYDWLPAEGIIAFRLDGAHPPREIKFSAIKMTDLAVSPSLAAAATQSFSDPAISNSEMTYAVAVQKANQNLDRQFETHINKLKAKKHDDAEVPAIAILENERKVFVEKGFIPWSEQMRSSAAEYLHAINNAQDKLEAEFKKAVQSAQKKGDDKRVAALHEEEQSVLAPHIVAIAEMVGADGETQEGNRIELRSDLLYSTPNDADSGEVRCWSLKGGHLILERPHPSQPSDAIRHECVLAPDGKTFQASGPVVAEQSWRFVTE